MTDTPKSGQDVKSPSLLQISKMLTTTNKYCFQLMLQSPEELPCADCVENEYCKQVYYHQYWSVIVLADNSFDQDWMCLKVTEDLYRLTKPLCSATYNDININCWACAYFYVFTFLFLSHSCQIWPKTSRFLTEIFRLNVKDRLSEVVMNIA